MALADRIEQVLWPVASFLGVLLEDAVLLAAGFKLSVSTAASDVQLLQQQQGRLLKEVEVFEGMTELQLLHQLATPPVMVDAQGQQLALSSPVPEPLQGDMDRLNSAAAVLVQQLMLQLMHEPQLLLEQLDKATADKYLAVCSIAATNTTLHAMCSSQPLCPSVEQVLTALQPCTPDMAPPQQVQPCSPDSVAQVRLLLTTPPLTCGTAAAAAGGQQGGSSPAARKMVALLERLQLLPQGGAAGRQEVVAALRRLLALAGVLQGPAAAAVSPALPDEQLSQAEGAVADALLQQFALPLCHVVAAAAAAGSMPGDTHTGTCSVCGLGPEPGKQLDSCSRCMGHYHAVCGGQYAAEAPPTGAQQQHQQQLCPSCQDCVTAAQAWEFSKALVQCEALLHSKLQQVLSDQRLGLLLQGLSEQQECGEEPGADCPPDSPAADTACNSPGRLGAAAAVDPHAATVQQQAAVELGPAGAAAVDTAPEGTSACGSRGEDLVMAPDLIIPSSVPEENDELDAAADRQQQRQQDDRSSSPAQQQEGVEEQATASPTTAAAADTTAAAADTTATACATHVVTAGAADSEATQQPILGIRRQLSGAPSNAEGAVQGAPPAKRHRLSVMSLPTTQQPDGPGQQPSEQHAQTQDQRQQQAGTQQQLVGATASAATTAAAATETAWGGAALQPSRAPQTADPLCWSAKQLLLYVTGNSHCQPSTHHWVVPVRQVLELQRDVCAAHPEAMALQELHLHLSSLLLQERLTQLHEVQQQVVQCVQDLVASVPCPAVREVLLQLVSPPQADATDAAAEGPQDSAEQAEQLLLALMLLGTFLPQAFQQSGRACWQWGTLRGVDRAWSLLRGDVQLQQCLDTLVVFSGGAADARGIPAYDCHWDWEWDWEALTTSAVGVLKQLLQLQMQLDVTAGPRSLNLQLLPATFQELYSSKQQQQPQHAGDTQACCISSSSICDHTEGPSAPLVPSTAEDLAPQAAEQAAEGLLGTGGTQAGDQLHHLEQRRSLLCELVRDLTDFAAGMWRGAAASADDAAAALHGYGEQGLGHGAGSCERGPAANTRRACKLQAAAAARDAATAEAAAAAWEALKAAATAAAITPAVPHSGSGEAAAAAACAVPLSSLGAAAAAAEMQGVRGALQISGALLVSYFGEHTPYVPGAWPPCLPFDCALWQSAYALCSSSGPIVLNDWKFEPVGALAACMAAFWELWSINSPSSSVDQGLFHSRLIWSELVASQSQQDLCLMQWNSSAPQNSPVEATGWLLLQRLFAVVKRARISLIPATSTEQQPLDEEMLLLFIKSARLQFLTRHSQQPFAHQLKRPLRADAAALRLHIGQLVMPELGKLLEALFTVPQQEQEQHPLQPLMQPVQQQQKEEKEAVLGTDLLAVYEQQRQPLLRQYVLRQLLKERLESAGRLVVSACISVLDLLLLPDEELLQQAGYVTAQPLGDFLVGRLSAATQALQQLGYNQELEAQLRSLQDCCNRRHQPVLPASVPASQLWSPV